MRSWRPIEIRRWSSGLPSAGCIRSRYRPLPIRKQYYSLAKGALFFCIEGTVRGETGRPTVTKVVQMPFRIPNSTFEGVI